MIRIVKIMTSNNIKKLMPFKSLNPVLLMLFLTACGRGSGKPGTKVDSADISILDTVAVFILKHDTLHKTVDLPGELIPYEQTDLYSKVSGFVKTICVDIGDRVHKGQTLAFIEAPEVNTRIAEAESSLRAAKAKWNSGKDNYDRLYRASQSSSPGIVAPVDLVNARNVMESDSATYESRRQQVKAFKEVSGYLSISAPFNGVVTSRKVDPGALVGTGTMILTVQNNNTLRLRVSVPEIYTASAGNSRNIIFSIDAYPEEKFVGALARKTETIDPVTRTELWEYEVNNADHKLKAGVFVNANIGIERKGQSFIIPSSAIATTQEKKFIIRVRHNKAEWIDVRQGMTTDSGIEVFGNLNTGDTLLVKGTDERKPGSHAYWKIQ
jgi:membrane fusion protein, multidrug efflux system